MGATNSTFKTLESSKKIKGVKGIDIQWELN